MKLGRISNALIVVLAVLGPVLLAQAARTTSESELKAAFVYNFAKFVTWPPESQSPNGKPLVIGVLGDPDLGYTLQKLLLGKALNGRPLEVHIFDGINDLRITDVLFVHSERKSTLETALQVTAGLPVLTVGDAEDFNELGGVVQLVREDRRMRFDINVTAAEHAGLRIHSQLLKLARTTPGN
ncbi:MAG: YfiR family protein [Acidobacteria bacterium]|nr:YfiR family protein [Acidobacteriota bacterium]